MSSPEQEHDVSLGNIWKLGAIQKLFGYVQKKITKNRFSQRCLYFISFPCANKTEIN